MIWLILSLAARADTFTLDNGTQLEGALAEYNLNGSCQVSVTQGELTGALVVIPCERIARFERIAAAPFPAPAPALAEELALPVETFAPLSEPMPVAQPFTEAPFAAAPVEDPLALPAASFAPTEPEAELAEAPLWADETGAEAGGAVSAGPPAPMAERSIGGVVLPSLPNLRMMRRPEASNEAPDADDPETL